MAFAEALEEIGIMGIDRPVLRYHGGKWLLAPWIISQMPHHRVYTETFGGAASVLMQKRRAYAEVYNDKWDTVVNVFRVLRDANQAAELKRMLQLTPFARSEFLATGDHEIAKIECPIERARRTILRSFAGFGSAATNAKYATGFRAISSRSGTTPAHDWVNLTMHLDLWVERLAGVVIENRDAARVMKDHDSKQTLHYVDPPYVHATRNMQRGNAAYECELADADHVELSKQLQNLKGMVIVSGYRCDLYDELYGHWRRVDHASLADGARQRTESLWFNPAAWLQSPQGHLFEAEK